MILFITGGARSGKSTAAVEAARHCGRAVVFVATATAGDDEMAVGSGGSGGSGGSVSDAGGGDGGSGSAAGPSQAGGAPAISSYVAVMSSQLVRLANRPSASRFRSESQSAESAALGVGRDGGGGSSRTSSPQSASSNMSWRGSSLKIVGALRDAREGGGQPKVVVLAMGGVRMRAHPLSARSLGESHTSGEGGSTTDGTAARDASLATEPSQSAAAADMAAQAKSHVHKFTQRCRPARPSRRWRRATGCC